MEKGKGNMPIEDVREAYKLAKKAPTADGILSIIGTHYESGKLGIDNLTADLKAGKTFSESRKHESTLKLTSKLLKKMIKEELEKIAAQEE
jgi:hypothetical protein